MTKTKNISSAFTLIEILVVMAIFAVLGLIISSSILLTLRGASKSESMIKVRENLDYAMSIIERQLRNSQSVTCPSVTQVNYVDQRSIQANFHCQDTLGTNAYIASDSASPSLSWRLTSPDIILTACSFTCTAASGNVRPKVDVSLEAKAANVMGIEGASVTTNTTIYLRNY